MFIVGCFLGKNAWTSMNASVQEVSALQGIYIWSVCLFCISGLVVIVSLVCLLLFYVKNPKK